MLYIINVIIMCLCNNKIKFDEFYEHFKKNINMLNYYKTTLKIENIDVKIIFLKSQTSTLTNFKCNIKRVKNS